MNTEGRITKQENDKHRNRETDNLASLCLQM